MIQFSGQRSSYRGAIGGGRLVCALVTNKILPMAQFVSLLSNGHLIKLISRKGLVD